MSTEQTTDGQKPAVVGLGLTDLLGGIAANTDRELWRESDDYYAPSIHVTAGGGIGINVGGLVIVRPLRRWHEAMRFAPLTAEEADAEYDAAPSMPISDEEIQAIVANATKTRYRKKPVVIDAWKIEPAIQDGELAQAVVDGKLKYCEDGSVLIATLEGTMQGFPGDWIIRGVNGELYPCKPDIFAKTYEAVV